MRLNSIALAAFYRFSKLMELFAMASSGDQCISRNSSSSSPAHQLANVGVTKDDLIVNARVTYAPLPIWQDFHWTCTVTSFAWLVPNHLK
jgi:hypothetical protein